MNKEKKDNKLSLCIVWSGSINHPLLWKLIINHLNSKFCTTENVDNVKSIDETKGTIKIPSRFAFTNQIYNSYSNQCKLHFTINKEDLETYLDTINYLCNRYDKLLDIKIICEEK